MTNIKDAPLKGCPFCGAKPHSGLGVKYQDQLHGEPHQDFAIWCPKGHAKVTRVNREQAADEWNTRASTSSPDREKVARLAYEGRHKGISNCWKWDDAELDREHPGTRSMYFNIADAILSTIAPDEAVKGQADER